MTNQPNVPHPLNWFSPLPFGLVGFHKSKPATPRLHHLPEERGPGRHQDAALLEQRLSLSIRPRRSSGNPAGPTEGACKGPFSRNPVSGAMLGGGYRCRQNKTLGSQISMVPLKPTLPNFLATGPNQEPWVKSTTPTEMLDLKQSPTNKQFWRTLQSFKLDNGAYT